MQPASTDERPVRAKSLTQRLVDDLSARIRQGVLRAGDRVPPEPELVREFSVSRTVVREAMQRLQAAGLVETQHGVGTFVLAPSASVTLLALGGKEVSFAELLEMLELRITVESEGAALAALRRTEEHLAGMQQALEDFEAHWKAGASTVEDDYRFHLQIAEASGNRYFGDVLRGLGKATISRPKAEAGESQPASAGQRKELAHQEHLAIVEAIRRGDAAAARAAMFMHLNNSRERLRRLVGSPAVR